MCLVDLLNRTWICHFRCYLTKFSHLMKPPFHVKFGEREVLLESWFRRIIREMNKQAYGSWIKDVKNWLRDMLISSPASDRKGIFWQQRPSIGWPYNSPSKPEHLESERVLCDTRTASINQDCSGPTPAPIYSCPNYKEHKYNSQHTVPQLILVIH